MRFGAERDAQIQQALSAIGQFAALDRLDAFQAKEPDQLHGLRVDFRVAVNVAPGIEAHRILRLQRQAQIFVDRQAAKQIRDLERACQALVAYGVGLRALDLAAVKAHGAAVRRVQARGQIEQRGLAGAVRADQGMNFSGGNFETGFGDGPNAAEMLRDSVDLQHRSEHRWRDQERR